MPFGKWIDSFTGNSMAVVWALGGVLVTAAIILPLTLKRVHDRRP